MKYVVTLNNKKYEVEVNESEAVLTSVYDAAPAMPAMPVMPAAPAAEIVPETNDDELVAVITAAIEAYRASEGLDGHGYRVVSFKKRNTKNRIGSDD